MQTLRKGGPFHLQNALIMSDFANHKYVQLITFRKTGTPVGTPMWFGLDGSGKMYMQTNAASAKVKRLRNRPELEVMPSDSRGKPLGAAWRGTATVHGPQSEVARTSIALLKQHYGWIFRVFNFGLWLFRRNLVYLEIQLEGPL